MRRRSSAQRSLCAVTTASLIPSAGWALSVGIDLGTSNSCLAVVNALGTPCVVRVCEDPYDRYRRGTLLPSVCEIVDAPEDGAASSGIQFAAPPEERSELSAGRRPQVTAWKRALGLTRSEVSWTLSDREARRLRLDDGAGDADGEVGLWVVEEEDTAESEEAADDAPTTIRRHRARPRECHAALIETLVRRAEAELGETIDKAVIGVPAMYLPRQRQAVEALATTILGPQGKVQLATEPELAAHAYGYRAESSKDALVMVFDLGGGTLDVSFVAVGGPTRTMEVVATAGDPCLGGIDFTRALGEAILEKAAGHKKKPSGGSPRHVDVDDAALVRAADAAKIQLSDSDVADVPLEGIFLEGADDDAEYPSFVQVTRGDFDRTCGDLFREIANCVRRAALSAGAALPGDAESFVRDRERDDRGRKLKKKRRPKYDDSLRELQDRLPKGQTLRPFPGGLGLEGDAARRIHDVVLVGGAYSFYAAPSTTLQHSTNRGPCQHRLLPRSKMPAIHLMLSTLTGCEVGSLAKKKKSTQHVDPEHAVAMGAAVRAAMNDQRLDDDFVVFGAWQAEVLRHFASQNEPRKRKPPRKKVLQKTSAGPKRDAEGRRIVTVKGPDGQLEQILVEDDGFDDDDDDDGDELEMVDIDNFDDFDDEQDADVYEKKKYVFDSSDE